MKLFFASLRPAFISLILLTLLLGIGYPLFMFGVGRLFFREEAKGSLILNQKGQVIGSKLIAQSFIDLKYFHPRPSNAGEKGYDAAHSSGSNLGPTSQKLMDALTQRVEEYRLVNKLEPNAMIPADAVTASGSGLDPHISKKNALLQLSRIASARGQSEIEIKNLIAEYTEGPIGWLFGEDRVNVLKLNLALDKMAKYAQNEK